MTPFIQQLLKQSKSFNPGGVTLNLCHSCSQLARAALKDGDQWKRRQTCKSGSSDLSLYCVSLPSPRFHCESDGKAESSQEEWSALGKTHHLWHTLTHFLWSLFSWDSQGKNAFKWKWLCSCFDREEGMDKRRSELRRSVILVSLSYYNSLVCVNNDVVRCENYFLCIFGKFCVQMTSWKQNAAVQSQSFFAFHSFYWRLLL